MFRFYLFISLLTSFGIFLLRNNKVSKYLYICLSFLLFFFVAAFRSMWVGVDTPSYYLLYKNINSFYSIESIAGHMETGFVYFCKLLSYINADPQFLLIATSFLIIFFIFRFIHKYSYSFFLSILMYSCDMFIFNLTGMRQSLAMICIIYSFDYVIKRKFLNFCLLILLASIFHKSAIAFIIVYFSFNYKLNEKKIIYCIVSAIFFSLLFPVFSKFIFIIFPSYMSYTSSLWFDNETKIASIMKLLVLIVVFIVSYFFYKKNKRHLLEKEILLDNVLLWISLISICVYIVSIKATILERLGFYFSLFNIILLPNITNRIKDRTIRVCINSFIIIFFILYASICLYYRSDWFGVIPYTFFWEI